MEKIFVAKRVAEKLWKTEAAIDAAMTETAELLATVLKAPADMGVSLTVVDGTQAKVMEALKALSEARTALVESHHEAYVAATKKIGLRPKMILDFGDHSHLDDGEQSSMQDVRRAG